VHAAALNALAIGIAVCDAAGYVVFANTAARELSRRGAGITIGRRGKRVSGRVPSETRDLARLIENAAGGRGGVVRLTGENGTVLPVLVTPLVDRDNGPHPAGYALVAVRAPAGEPSATAAMFAELFQLSPTQAAIALSIFNGNSPEDIARERGIKISTLRTHLAQIFVRTGTDTQRDLVRLLGSIPPLR
jgi:DNA-binding CsgD family transcriptional regulator